MKNKVDISIVIPVYNSSGSLHELYERIDKTMSTIQKKYELILVDDGSKDESWKVLTEIKQLAEEKVIAIRLEKNRGQHTAIVCGFNFCSGNVVITMDDDLQHPPEEIVKLVNKYEETNPQVVYGIYKSRQHGFMRSKGSVMVQKSSKYFADYKGSVGSSFRLLTKSIVDKIKNHSQTFIFIDEIMHWYSGDIDFIEVEHHARKKGKSTYTFFKLVNLYLSILVNFTAWPLKFMVYIGSFASFISFLVGARFIYKKLYYDIDVEGFTAIIVAITFSTSLILICLGIIGQYIYKMYQQQNGKPPYSINKII